MKDRRDLDSSAEETRSVRSSEESHSVETPVMEHGLESASSGLSPAQRRLMGLQRSVGNRFVVNMLGANQAGTETAGTQMEPDAALGLSPHSNPSAHSAAPRPDSGQPLDPETRSAMESRLGQDFSQVRVHTDAASGNAAQALHAQAFTMGNDVFFGSGRYRSEPNDPLLAHELAHVVQQRGGGTTASTAVSEDPKLEAQAERSEGGLLGPKPSLGHAPRGLQRKPDAGSASTTNAPASHEPSFFEKLGRGVAAFGKSVWHGLEAAGSAIWKGVKAVGHGIAVAAEAVWTGIQWVSRQLWDKLTGIFERVTQWVARLPERLARLVMGLWEGVKSLHPWSLKWWESLGHASTWLDFLKWLGRSALQLAEVLGIPEIVETLADLLKFNTRSLSGGERSKAASVFGGSINLDLVRVDEGGLIGPSWTKREYTAFHTITGWGGIQDDTLIHELTHVWQYERAGAIYIAQALHAQITLGGTGAYDYNGVPGLQAAKSAGQSILSFNREQQAQIVQDFYRIKTGRSPIFGAGTPADLPLYAHFVKEVSTLTEAQLVAV
jgi:hypothetical protein